jgi:hypothetical protein
VARLTTADRAIRTCSREPRLAATRPVFLRRPSPDVVPGLPRPRSARSGPALAAAGHILDISELWGRYLDIPSGRISGYRPVNISNAEPSNIDIGEAD